MRSRTSLETQRLETTGHIPEELQQVTGCVLVSLGFSPA